MRMPRSPARSRFQRMPMSPPPTLHGRSAPAVVAPLGAGAAVRGCAKLIPAAAVTRRPPITTVASLFLR